MHGSIGSSALPSPPSLPASPPRPQRAPCRHRPPQQKLYHRACRRGVSSVAPSKAAPSKANRRHLRPSLDEVVALLSTLRSHHAPSRATHCPRSEALPRPARHSNAHASTRTRTRGINMDPSGRCCRQCLFHSPHLLLRSTLSTILLPLTHRLRQGDARRENQLVSMQVLPAYPKCTWRSMAWDRVQPSHAAQVGPRAAASDGTRRSQHERKMEWRPTLWRLCARAHARGGDGVHGEGGAQ